MSIAELADSLQVSRPSASRLLQTLQQVGLVSRSHQRGNYTLGLGLWSLGGSAVGLIPGRKVAMAALAKFLPDLGRPINLGFEQSGVLFGSDQMEMVDGQEAVTPIGRPVPLHATSIGKAFLAF